MISTTTPNTPAAAAWASFPAATAAPKTAVIAVTRLRAQETSALVQVMGGTAHVPATGLSAGADALRNAPVQGPPSRGTPV